MNQYQLTSLSESQKFAEKMAKRLKNGGILFLYGDLGAGKTTLTQYLAGFLNIKSRIKSPTYTLVQDYQLENQQVFYHLDLYRLRDFTEIYEIGYAEIMSNLKNIVVVEWSERIPEEEKPARRIDVFLKINAKGERMAELVFKRPNKLSETKIQALLDEFATPQNVRKHTKLVSQVALKLGEKLIEKGEIVDLELLYEAAMLHDLVRVVDFRELKRESFEEEITEKKWQIWNEIREKYQGKSHAKVAQEILTQRGFNEVSEIIRRHCTSCILESSRQEELITWEDKLLYYADKRVKNDKIVPMEERFRIGRDENGHLIKSLARSIEIEAEANELEREIFRIINEKVDAFTF